MKLEVGNFPVKEIRFGAKTGYADGVFTVNKDDALAKVKEDEHITDADLHIVNPGDMVRLVPVKDAVQMSCRVEGAKGMYPGATAPLESAAWGKIHALQGASLIVVGKHWGSFQDGVIDMGGPYQRNTLYGSLRNLVLVGDTDEEFERHEQQKTNRALRWAGLRLAEYLGESLKELNPAQTDIWDLDAINRRPKEIQDLPSVVYVMQPQSQMEAAGYNTLIYGWDLNKMIPTLMHPNEILGGAVVAGSFMPCSSKMSTYEFTTNPTIKRLMREHGKTMNFLGVIMSNLNVIMEQKVRSAMCVAQIARDLGADGAIVAEEGYGNPDVDYIQVIVELEKAGVKTVGISNECTGRDGASQPLVALDEKATALVSCGNVSELYNLQPMTVIGELEALARDGLSGGWAGCVKPDGSAMLEDNSWYCGDNPSGYSVKRCFEY